MQISGVNNPMEAAKWGKTPLIQKKAVEASKNAMTDDFVKKLQELAREDAQKGVCMDKKAIQMRHSQMAKYVSPDRSAPIAQMLRELQKAAALGTSIALRRTGSLWIHLIGSKLRTIIQAAAAGRA